MTMDPERTPLEQLLDGRRGALALARRLLGDAAGAEDLVQEGLLAAWVSPARVGKGERWWKLWLRRRAASALRSERRREHRESVAASPEAQDSARESVARLQCQQILAEELLAIEPDFRGVLLLRYYEGMSAEDTAARLGVPVNTVYSRTARGLSKMRARLERRLGPEAREWLSAWVFGFPTFPMGPSTVGSSAAGSAAGSAAVTASATVLTPSVTGGILMNAKAVVVVFASAVVGGALWYAERGSSPTHSISEADLSAPLVVAGRSVPDASSEAQQREAVPGPLSSAGTSAVRGTLGSVLVRGKWAESGEPASGIEFTLTQGRERRIGRTGADGTGLLENVPAGAIHVTGDRGGRCNATVVAGSQVEVELALGPGIELKGEVVDVRGDPIADAEVWLSEGNNFALGHVVARSGGDGRFRVPGVGPHLLDPARLSLELQGQLPDAEPHRYLCARAWGFAPSDLVTLEVSVPWEPIRLVLPALGSSVRGRVLDPSGSPVVHASVVLAQEGLEQTVNRSSLSVGGMAQVVVPSIQTTTDESGSFEFLGWREGRSQLVVRSRECANFSEAIELVAGGAYERTIVLSPGCQVEGLVRGADGAPKRDVLVRAGPAYGAPTTYSQADGTFLLEGVAEGLAEIEARTSRGDARAVAVLECTPGDGVVWNPTLTSEGGEIRGRLLDSAGRPLEGWLVDVRNEETRQPLPGVSTEATGEFVVRNCRWDGSYELALRGGPFVATKISGTRPSAMPIDLVVPSNRMPTAAIEGRLVDVRGEPVEGGSVTIQSGSSSTLLESEAGTGRFRCDHLTPGMYRVRVLREGMPALEVGEGEVGEASTWDIGTIQVGS